MISIDFINLVILNTYIYEIFSLKVKFEWFQDFYFLENKNGKFIEIY